MTLELKSCPSCGAGLKSHALPDADHNEAWLFYCGAEVLRFDNGHLTDEFPCNNALRMALARLNYEAKHIPHVRQPEGKS